MAEFELRKTDSGHFNFSLKNEHDKTLLRSEQYNSKASALNGIESIRTNSTDDARYELNPSSNGEFYFNLKAHNGQVIGTSVMYATESSRAEAVAETKKVAHGAGVVENF